MTSRLYGIIYLFQLELESEKEINCVCFLCRYQRGCRSLAANLQAQGSVVQNQVITAAANEDDDEEEYDIPGEIENVVGVLKLDRNDCYLNIYWKTTCLVLRKSCGYLG